MAEYVAKIRVGASDSSAQDLVSFITDHRDNLNAAPKGGQVRGTDPAEASAVADLAAGLRDALGVSDVVTYHVCRHDEGIGACVPEVR